MKHSIFNSETGILAGDFIRTLYTNIDDIIAASKFALTPLAHKVFKSKKIVRVKDEKECKEWSRSKRTLNLPLLKLEKFLLIISTVIILNVMFWKIQVIYV